MDPLVVVLLAAAIPRALGSHLTVRLAAASRLDLASLLAVHILGSGGTGPLGQGRLLRRLLGASWA